MVGLDSIRGHARQREQLEKARQSERVAHAYLFSGPEGVGKEMVAFSFAQALNCARQELAPCGQCDSCGKVSKGAHPDVRLVACEQELVERGLIEPEKSRSPSATPRARRKPFLPTRSMYYSSLGSASRITWEGSESSSTH